MTVLANRNMRNKFFSGMFNSTIAANGRFAVYLFTGTMPDPFPCGMTVQAYTDAHISDFVAEFSMYRHDINTNNSLNDYLINSHVCMGPAESFDGWEMKTGPASTVVAKQTTTITYWIGFPYYIKSYTQSSNTYYYIAPRSGYEYMVSDSVGVTGDSTILTLDSLDAVDQQPVTIVDIALAGV